MSRSFTRSHSTSTSTTKGFSIGGKFAYTSKGSANILFARAESSVGVEVNGTYTFSKNENETEGTSESTTVSISTPAEAGYTTRLDVYSTKRDARYNYEANLLFGKVNGAEHVNTPAPLGLDQSPARSQPCLPLIVGSGSSHNSMQNIAVSILNSGVSPVDLPPDRRETLNGIGNFGTPGGLCPGFPNQFAAQASFHGTGVANYADMATGADGTPATDYEACVYRAPFGSSAPTYVRPVTARLARVLTRRSTAAPTAGDSPCRVVPNNSIVRGEAPGVQIDDRSLTGSDGSRPTIAGPNRSDEISGSDAPRETIYTGTGAFDIVHGGDGAGDRIVGGAGDNLIHGGSGNGDRLIAGSGGNELDAGNGRGDVLQDTAGGHAVLTGGSGGDTFIGKSMRGAMIGGRGNDTMISIGGASHLDMGGGGGDDTYRIEGAGRGVPDIAEFPGGGDDTVITDRSLKVPLYVENAIATGAQAVTLRGDTTTRRLVANRGDDTLVAGPGPEVLRGGPGRDTIVLADENQDIATGGTGVTHYVLTGTPQLFQRPAPFADPADRTADLITNFDAARGDRLILRSSVFGAPLLRLRRSFTVVAGRDPKPRSSAPTLLFDRTDHVLSFDRDGDGPISDQVVAKLPTLATIRRADVVIQK